MTGCYNRREFLKGLSCASLLPIFGGCATTPAACGRGYSVALLGDIHYDTDRWERFHEAVADITKARHYSEFVRNTGMWKERLPALLVASRRSLRPDTVFAVQLGDVVQGDARDGALQGEMLAEAYARLRATYGDLPVHLVTGNHDVRCPDGKKAYRDWCGRDTNYLVRQGPDAWIFFDFNSPPSLEWVEKTFAETEGCRWTFVLTHGPAFPTGGKKPRWFLFGDEGLDETRREFRRLMAERRAIVLAGHTHHFSHSVFEFPEGRVVQLVSSSVWVRGPQREIVLKEIDPAKWCTNLSKMPEKFHDDFRRLTAEYRPYLRLHRRCDAAGHCRLEVSDDGVVARLFGGDAVTSDLTVALA